MMMCYVPGYCFETEFSSETSIQLLIPKILNYPIQVYTHPNRLREIYADYFFGYSDL